MTLFSLSILISLFPFFSAFDHVLVFLHTYAYIFVPPCTFHRHTCTVAYATFHIMTTIYSLPRLSSSHLMSYFVSTFLPLVPRIVIPNVTTFFFLLCSYLMVICCIVSNTAYVSASTNVSLRYLPCALMHDGRIACM